MAGVSELRLGASLPKQDRFARSARRLLFRAQCLRRTPDVRVGASGIDSRRQVRRDMTASAAPVGVEARYRAASNQNEFASHLRRKRAQ